MFTLEQIKTAHSKVKSGADFPSYIKEIQSLGVSHYVVYVTDGHTVYYGDNAHQVTAPAKYETIRISDVPNTLLFKAELLAHQQGKTDYMTFIKKCTETGIDKWEVSINKMTCTYYDKAGNQIMEEQIPH